MQYCLTSVRMAIKKKLSIDKGVEKRKPARAIGGNVNESSHYEKLYGDFLEN